MARTNSSKIISDYSGDQVLRKAANNEDGSISVSGFVASKVGAKVTLTIVQSSPAIDDYRYFDVVQTQTGTTSSGFPTVTGFTNAQIDFTVGQYLFGTGIPENTTVLSIDSNSQITMSANATASGSTSIKFANLLYRIRLQFDDADRTNLLDAERLE